MTPGWCQFSRLTEGHYLGTTENLPRSVPPPTPACSTLPSTQGLVAGDGQKNIPECLCKGQMWRLVLAQWLGAKLWYPAWLLPIFMTVDKLLPNYLEDSNSQSVRPQVDPSVPLPDGWRDGMVHTSCHDSAIKLS